jgi:hypothetical protein
MEPLHNQGLQKLCTFMHQVNQHTTCGQRFQITTEQLRLETGYPGPFTDVPYSLVGPCATSSWLKSLWQFCHKHEISLHDPFGTFQLARENNVFVMPLFAQHVKCSSKLQVICKC